MSGAYLRVQRDGKWLNIEVEHLTPEERQEALRDRGAVELLRWLDLVCKKLAEADGLLTELAEEDILERGE